jgi:bacillithiol synthase
MQLDKIPLAETHAFNSFFLDYIDQKESLKPFYHRYPAVANFQAQLAEKQSFPQATRQVLTAALREQYKNVKLTTAVETNIAALEQSNTFTVTTGHQLNIFTGPLYFLYKIVTVINACKELKAAYPQYTFVPVYWMASEDHDYAEIKSFRLYGKKYTWETEQAGAVGRFHTKEFQKLLTELPGDLAPFAEAYIKNHTLSDAVRHYVHALFGEQGLVILDADHAGLKAILSPVMHEDILGNVSKDLVEHTNREIEKQGYHPQVFCRDINFFYLDNHLRARLERVGDRYQVVDSALSFSETEMKAMIDKHPEKLSPNVILRPLYQEMILPNLAYAGGPAEVIYWLQLQSVFQHFKVPFPILMPRNFAMVMDHTVYRKFQKTELQLKELFEEKNYIFNHWVLQHSKHNLTVSAERAQAIALFEELKKRADSIDQTLTAYVAAEGKRALHSLEKIEHKLLRAEKRLHADRLGQIAAVKDALFPNGSLQERTDNLLNFYQQDKAFIQKLLSKLEPFDFRFHILSYLSA